VHSKLSLCNASRGRWRHRPRRYTICI